MSRSAFENSGIDRVVHRKGGFHAKSAGLWCKYPEKRDKRYPMEAFIQWTAWEMEKPAPYGLFHII